MGSTLAVSAPVVAVLFFAASKFLAFRFPEDEDIEIFGAPLWKPKNRSVMRWSTDMAVCRDERWTVIGPFRSREEALKVIAAIPSKHLDGHRILDEHCFTSHYKLASRVWTDG